MKDLQLLIKLKNLKIWSYLWEDFSMLFGAIYGKTFQCYITKYREKENLLNHVNLVNNVDISTHAHDYIRMEITLLYLKILRHQLSI